MYHAKARRSQRHRRSARGQASLISRAQNHVRDIRDQSRGARLPELARELRVVDGPYVYRTSESSRKLYHAPGEDGKHAMSGWDGDCAVGDARATDAKYGANQESRDLAARCPRYERSGMERCERTEIERRDHAPIAHPQLRENSCNRFHGCCRLELDEQRQGAEPLDHLHQRGDAYPLATVGVAASTVGGESIAGIRLANGSQGQLGHLPGEIGGSIECAVVDHHRNAIGGDVDVELAPFSALLERECESGKRVLRRVGRSATVRDHRMAGQIEQRIHKERCRARLAARSLQVVATIMRGSLTLAQATGHPCSASGGGYENRRPVYIPPTAAALEIRRKG